MTDSNNDKNNFNNDSINNQNPNYATDKSLNNANQAQKDLEQQNLDQLDDTLEQEVLTSLPQGEVEPGTILQANVTTELKKSYLDYAMSVIAARALPDVRDGLKPSQRRLLVAMKDLNLYPNQSYKKCAKIVGETMGNYHPHGDQSAYMTLVHMAQDFSLRYPLIHGQGNFGSIDGDPPAQMRYTEAKMHKISTELLSLLDKGVVEFVLNFDASKLEPTILPALFPNLLANGTEGIAVGMATKIPPHNLGELIDALIAMIDKGNKWNGISLYNFLRQAREKRHKLPALLPQHPQDLLEFYFDEQTLSNKVYKNILTKIIKQTKFTEQPEAINAISEIFKDQAQDFLDLIKQAKENKKQFGLYPQFTTDITIDELMQYIKGPDFPTYGEIYNPETLKEVYATGKGKITIRGVAKVEEHKGKHRIIITQIPYQVNKAQLIETIAKLVQAQKIKHIKDIRDESGKEGIRVVIELKKEANPFITLNKLYKFTPLQINYHANMIALLKQQPITINLKKYLEIYLSFRMQIAIRALEFELAEVKYKAHILEGLLKALDFIDEVIKIIRSSKTQEQAKENLIKRFDLTTIQAQAILDMQLKRLAALERQKIEDDYKKHKDVISHHEEYLASDSKILELIKQDLLRIKEKYADKRRTKIKGKLKQLTEQDLIHEESVLITITQKGFIKRTPLASYQAQRARGVGSKSISFKDNDSIVDSIVASTKDTILIFTDDGKVYPIFAYEIPEFKGKSRGAHLSNLTGISPNQNVVSVLTQQSLEKGYLLFATKKGMVKKTKVSAYKNINKTGLIAINLKKEDMLEDVIYLEQDKQVLIITAKGNSIRIDTKEVRDTGRATAGVKGISFKKQDDYVVSIKKLNSDLDLVFIITQKGYGKFTPVGKFKVQHRGGKGIRSAKITEKTGNIVKAIVMPPLNVEHQQKAGYKPEQIPQFLILITGQGRIIKIKVTDVPILSRNSQGNRLIKVKPTDQVVNIGVE